MKKLIFPLLLFLITSFGYPTTQVSVSVSSTLGTIGERIILKFIVQTSSDSDSIKIHTGKPEFEIIKEKPLSVHKKNDLTTFEKDFEISFFKTGDFEIGPYKLELSKNNKIIEKLTSNSIPVNIKSVLEEEDKDIKPLKDLYEIDGNPFYLLKYPIILGFIAIIMILIRYFFKKYIKRKQVDPIPLLPPDEEFKKRIKSLWNSDLIHLGKFKIFFLSLTEAYKSFMNRQYKFNAEDLTTYEIIKNLKKNEPDTQIIENFEKVFVISDLTKFAKYEPSSEDFNLIKRLLLDIVNAISERRKLQEKKETENVSH